MNTDKELREFILKVKELRCYDDEVSNLYRVALIDELTTQMRNTMKHNHEQRMGDLR